MFAEMPDVGRRGWVWAGHASATAFDFCIANNPPHPGPPPGEGFIAQRVMRHSSQAGRRPARAGIQSLKHGGRLVFVSWRLLKTSPLGEVAEGRWGVVFLRIQGVGGGMWVGRDSNDGRLASLAPTTPTPTLPQGREVRFRDNQTVDSERGTGPMGRLCRGVGCREWEAGKSSFASGLLPTTPSAGFFEEKPAPLPPPDVRSRTARLRRRRPSSPARVTTPQAGRQVRPYDAPGISN